VSVLGIVDANWKGLHYDECQNLLPLLRELQLLTTLSEVRALADIFCEKTFKDRFGELLPYPIFQFQHEDLKRKLGVQIDFDVGSVSQILRVLSERQTGNPEIWRYLYEYLRDAQKDFKLEGIMIKLPCLYIPGQLERAEHESNFIPIADLRWSGDQSVASLCSLVLVAESFPDSFHNLFGKVFGVLEGLTVSDHVGSISALHRIVDSKQRASKDGFESREFADLLLAYGSLNQVLEESVRSTLHPLDNLPILIEKGKGVRAFEIYHLENQRRGEILPHIDDWFEPLFFFFFFFFVLPKVSKTTICVGNCTHYLSKMESQL